MFSVFPVVVWLRNCKLFPWGSVTSMCPKVIVGESVAWDQKRHLSPLRCLGDEAREAKLWQGSGFHSGLLRRWHGKSVLKRLMDVVTESRWSGEDRGVVRRTVGWNHTWWERPERRRRFWIYKLVVRCSLATLTQIIRPHLMWLIVAISLYTAG